VKRFGSVLLVLCTLALVAAGAAMPFAASRVQDARQSGVEARTFDSFRLTLQQKTDLGQLLRLMTGNEWLDVVEVKNSVLSPLQAIQTARETLDLLYKYGLIDKKTLSAAENPEVYGFAAPETDLRGLAAPAAPDVIYAIWTVSWSDLGIHLWLDDASGKASEIYLTDMDWGMEKFDESMGFNAAEEEEFAARLENWRLFMQEYYDLPVQEIEELSHSYAWCYRLYVDLEDGGGLLPLMLELYGDRSVLYPVQLDDGAMYPAASADN